MTNEKMKRNRWLKRAPERVNRLAHDYQLLINTANKNNYIYTESEVEELVRAVEEMHATFLKAWKKPSRKPFKFDNLPPED